MRIVVTGATGQLGSSLQRALSGHDIVPMGGRANYDITNKNVIDSIVSFKPDIVIHTAAMTGVDRCEKDPEGAYLANVLGTRFIATACVQCGARLAYISTDYVFDGTKADPYNEEDLPHPLNVYGKTKLAGERPVQDLVLSHYIIRTAWLYGNGKNNFVKKILARAECPPVPGVTTEVGSPTNADDLAGAIQRLIQYSNYGIFHITNQGACSRYEWIQAILQLSGLGNVPIEAKNSYDRPAIVPLRAVLKNNRAAALGIVLRPWREALASYIINQDK